MHYLYTTFIYNPLYNGLIYLINILHKLTFVDAGIIIILFTIIVRLILFPLSKRAVRTQAMMKLAEPELAAIKEKYKNDKQAQALATMQVYKEKKINPFSSILLLFIQIPILFALYRIFYTSGFTSVHADILYPFVHAPALPSTLFLGFLDITKKSVVLAVIAAVSQYFQISLSAPKAAKKENATAQEDFARNMQTQMKYVFPVMILVISYNLPGALPLYWITSNLFMIGQELYIRKQLAKESAPKSA